MGGQETQNNNKGDTLTFRYSRTNDVYTVSRLAKLQGKSPSTIRKRYERGWLQDEIIEGKRASKVSAHVVLEHTVSAYQPSHRPIDRDLLPHLSRAQLEAVLHRERYDQDDYLESFETWKETMPHITFEMYKNKFARAFWPNCKEYMTYKRFSKQPESVQTAVREIDPDFSAKMDAEKATLEELKDLL